LSPLDPAQPFALDPVAGQYDRVADLSRRLAVLERGGGRRSATAVVVPVGAGAPSHDTVDGALYVDLTNARLYARANGTWRWVALT
jgi:hypothetical protein